jgi:hypothetical protein
MSSISEKPIPGSYWVLPGQFLAGEYPALTDDESGTRQRLAAFVKDGFSAFIDLTCEGERQPYDKILKEDGKDLQPTLSHRRFSFVDFGVPTRTRMVLALDSIDAALAEGRKVYLHCLGGIGRTGTTVGCWLIRHGMEPERALQHLGELYRTSAQSRFMPQSPESRQQVQFLLNWSEDGLA